MGGVPDVCICVQYTHSSCQKQWLGGDVCGEIGRLGHKKEVVCIVSWEGMYVGRSGAWDTRKRLYVL